jgi:hypothetical protein
VRFRVVLIALSLAAGCKTDPTESASVKATGGEGARAGRTGHVDLPTRVPPGHREGDPKGDWKAERREERRARHEAEMDTDGDGIVSPEERGADRKERAITMHSRLDRDHDGRLTPAELGDTPFGRRYNVATIDKNNDGDVSPDELVTAMETYIPPPRKRGKHHTD